MERKLEILAIASMLSLSLMGIADVIYDQIVSTRTMFFIHRSTCSGSE